MNKKVYDLMLNQINKELYSSYLYMDMANFYEEKGLGGFAHWFNKQAHEEFEHAEAFINYLHNVDQKVTLAAIDGINEEYKGLIDPLKKQVEHEACVTSLIVAIYEAAIEANDYGAKLFLEGFIKEQEEEEKNARDMLDSFKMVEGEKVGVFMLNSEYGKR